MNTKKFKSVLAIKGKTQKDILKVLKCGYMTLNKKVNGQIGFSTDEIGKVKNFLELTDNEVVEIFINS